MNLTSELDPIHAKLVGMILPRSFDSFMLKSMEMAAVDMLSPAQCRMARAALGLSISDASKVSLVSRATIVRFEAGNVIRPVLQSALKTAYERLGVEFTVAGVEIPSKGSLK